ncbi:MAG: hypothetical protein JJ934_09935 [Pseudomonadales bacterium]|nr:hypothetical protein [Pseudomonadales bacterium]
MLDIKLYGVDHSPWVQAVMLGLHDKNIEYTRSTVAALEAFIKWGVMMPAASFDGEPWQLESKDILHRLGYDAVSDEDMKQVRLAWQGVLHRVDVWPRFWGEFSVASDPDQNPLARFLKNFFRSFATFYFFLLMNFARLMGQGVRPENFGDQYLDWEERFSKLSGPYLGGDEPNAVDLLLFGVIQCHSSIPVPPLTALQTDPRLIETRQWIGRMQSRFSDYSSLYSGVYFKPHSPAPRLGSGIDQLAFWLGAIFMVSLFWITVPLAAILAARNQRLR